MKKLSKKEQAQLLVDKFFAFYFKRYEKKNIDELEWNTLNQHLCDYGEYINLYF